MPQTSEMPKFSSINAFPKTETPLVRIQGVLPKKEMPLVSIQGILPKKETLLVRIQGGLPKKEMLLVRIQGGLWKNIMRFLTSFGMTSGYWGWKSDFGQEPEIAMSLPLHAVIPNPGFFRDEESPN